jgi:hypothetical protein
MGQPRKEDWTKKFSVEDKSKLDNMSRDEAKSMAESLEGEAVKQNILCGDTLNKHRKLVSSDAHKAISGIVNDNDMVDITLMAINCEGNKEQQHVIRGIIMNIMDSNLALQQAALQAASGMAMYKAIKVKQVELKELRHAVKS